MTAPTLTQALDTFEPYVANLQRSPTTRDPAMQAAWLDPLAALARETTGAVRDRANYGYYLAKKERVLKTSGKLKRLSVTIPASNFRASGSNFSGKFEGWYVVAIGLQACSFISPNSKKPRHFTKDELLSLVFISPVDAAAKAIRPGNKKLEVVQSRYVEELRVID